MLTQIYCKKNELQEAESFQDKECTVPLDFTGKMHLYLQADISALLELLATHQVKPEAEIFVPRLPNSWYELSLQDCIANKVQTIDDITLNLSKYIPEDNAVLFLSEEDKEQYAKCVLAKTNSSYMVAIFDNFILCSYDKQFPKNYKNATIFLPNGTQSELQKAIEVAKYLWENFGIKPELFVLHCFKSYWRDSIFHPKNIDNLRQAFGSDFTQDTNLNGFSGIQIKDYEYLNDCRTKWKAYFCNFNKIITTNSTDILEPQNTERLQVIDCKEIFEEYLKEGN